MTYEDTTFRRKSGDNEDSVGYRANAASAADYRQRRRDLESDAVDPSAESSRRPSADDANGRDRLGIHLGWEIVLLLAVAAIGYLLYRLDPASLRRPALDTLLITGTAIGLLTLGAGLTLRAGVPNLAVGPVALAGALHYAEQGDRGLIDAAVPALGIAAAGGLLLALLVLGLHVPAWVATLGAGMAVTVFVQLRIAPVDVQGNYDPSDQAFYLFGGFALVAVVGAALGSAAPVRRVVGRMRPVADPAARRGAAAALPVIGSLVVSSVLAVAAGILIAAQSTEPIEPGTGLEWTGIAFGTALFAGTSAFGRRGGIFGTLLAVAGVTLFLDYSARRDLDIALFAIAAALIGAGLVVTRLVETYGRPLPVGVSEEEWTGAAAAGTTWTPDLPETWSTSVPTQNRSDRWDDGPWGTNR
ncbi:MAG TPA: ABC transporter permease [Actinoplanes sp.]|nr:ABC transporter permease [Actinoplanes sp.]